MANEQPQMMPPQAGNAPTPGASGAGEVNINLSLSKEEAQALIGDLEKIVGMAQVFGDLAQMLKEGLGQAAGAPEAQQQPNVPSQADELAEEIAAAQPRQR